MAIITQSTNLTNILAKELAALENIHRQNPDTGANADTISTYLGQYTNHLFGSPFQLIDSVDKRFDSVNSNLGAEYMRNFTLNSPILHIKPGMTKYTGGGDGGVIATALRTLYANSAASVPETGSFTVGDLIEAIAGVTIFGSGSKLQRRMFGFQDTYYQYMSNVNYMCRSIAAFLCLVPSRDLADREQTLPYGTFTNKSPNDLETFDKIDWSNYRFLSTSLPMNPWEELQEMAKSSIAGKAINKAAQATVDWINKISGEGSTTYVARSGELVSTGIIGHSFTETENTDSTMADQIRSLLENNSGETARSIVQAAMNDSGTKIVEGDTGNITDVIVDKVSSVMFMVEPTSFEENIRNDIGQSLIESSIDKADQGLGKEIAFITNSNVDFGTIDGLTSFLGVTLDTVAESLSGIVEAVNGGFLSNLLHGAISSVKGQKMIYPDIYKSSTSEMDFDYTVNLVSPYGDDYNYYMNIAVPLAHLICLAAPRAVTSNSISSPFIVQTWIPGISTCQLGMISGMRITKNPENRHMSVHGFPLEVKVTFTVKELYNALSISPANDPASFLFNETLNDYMANMGGLSPCSDTYRIQRKIMFAAEDEYLTSGDLINDFTSNIVSNIENFVNPYVHTGQ